MKWPKALFAYILGSGTLALSAVGVFGIHPISGDEGVVLNMAWQAWQGREWYTEVIEYLPPITPLISYSTWALTGKVQYVSVLAVFIVIWLCVAGYMYWWLRKYGVQKKITWLTIYAWLAISGYHVLINHNSLSAQLSIVTLLLWLHSRFNPSLIHTSDTDIKIKVYPVITWIAIGVGLALILLTLHTKGLALVAVVLTVELYWLLKGTVVSIRRMATIVLSMMLVVIQMFWWWSPAVLWEAFIVLPQTNKYIANTFYTAPGLLWLVIICIYTTWLLWQYRDRTQLAQVISLLGLIQFIMLVSTWYIVDSGHVWLSAWPTLIAIALHINARLLSERAQANSKYIKQLSSGRRVETWRIYILMWPLLALLPLLLLRIVITVQWHINTYINGEVIPGSEILATLPDASIFAGPFAPGVYFELGKDNPYVYTHNLVLCNPVCVSSTLRVLETEQPDFVLWSHWAANKMKYQPTEIDAYIAANYSVCANMTQSQDISWLARNDIACPE